MLPNNHSDFFLRFNQLKQAIYYIYNDFIHKQPSDSQEMMAIVINPIPGIYDDTLAGPVYYPLVSGVANSFFPYALNTEDVRTIGVKATFVTSKNTDDDIVYAITKEVFGNFEDFKSLHPAYEVLTKQDMLKGLSAPIHKGALKYYKEVSLDKYISPKLIID